MFKWQTYSRCKLLELTLYHNHLGFVGSLSTLGVGAMSVAVSAVGVLYPGGFFILRFSDGRIKTRNVFS